MMSSVRVVCDTNVVVSGLLFPNSVPGRILFEETTGIVPLISDALASELARVLEREKFDPYVSLERRIALAAAWIARCEPIEVTFHLEVCRDPSDNHVLELAVAGGANVILTGDNDLLTLDPFRGIRIQVPKAFEIPA
jgi:uncharacterized protein